MNPLPRAGVCQGNFAAIVKEILPIYQCDALATAGSIDSNPPIIIDIGGKNSLTDRR